MQKIPKKPTSKPPAEESLYRGKRFSNCAVCNPIIESLFLQIKYFALFLIKQRLGAG
jgi:hypothetical protein